MTDEELSKRASTLMTQTNGLHDSLVNIIGGYCDQRAGMVRILGELKAEVYQLNNLNAVLNDEVRALKYDVEQRDKALAEKVEGLFAADEKLKSEIYWRSVLFWLMALLAVILLIAGGLK